MFTFTSISRRALSDNARRCGQRAKSRMSQISWQIRTKFSSIDICDEIGAWDSRGIRARFFVEYLVQMKLNSPNAAGRKPRSTDRSARCLRKIDVKVNIWRGAVS